MGGDDIINEGELSELTDFDGNITITGTVSNPSASMKPLHLMVRFIQVIK